MILFLFYFIRINHSNYKIPINVCDVGTSLILINLKIKIY